LISVVIATTGDAVAGWLFCTYIPHGKTGRISGTWVSSGLLDFCTCRRFDLSGKWGTASLFFTAMSGCPLPIWIQWLQALAVPVIAAVGVWIALQQMHLARVKLQHDTYDRKYGVFVAVRSVLTVVAGLKRAPHLEDMRDFINEIGAAPFLFDDDKLVRYLEEVERRVYRANGLNDIIIMSTLSDGDKVNASKELEEHILWLSEQSNIITEKFRRSLELRKRHCHIRRPHNFLL
jgi:hypothetical protein